MRASAGKSDTVRVLMKRERGAAPPRQASTDRRGASPGEAGDWAGRAYHLVVPEERKLVTVLFADIVGSTALTASADPEVVRGRLADLFARTRRILVGHGATVEKFVGDAVMAIFGIPATHEDDAERAIRAAAALLAEFAGSSGGPLGRIELRIGVNTGEVVAGSPDTGDFMVTGEAVNAGARLQQAAAPGEILTGPLTRRLTGSTARYGPVRRVEAKGLGEIEAWPFAGLVPNTVLGARTATSATFVGRERELALLTGFWEHTIASGRPYLVTIFGEAGIGKSRIAEEFVASVRPPNVARGRCPPYGEGVGLRPIEEIVGPSDGTTDVDASTRFRRHLETLSQTGPVALVLEDIHWGEPPLLDAIEELADRGRGPILVLCLARDDLLALRPAWGGGRANAATIALGPLPDPAVERLIGSLDRSRPLPQGAHAYVIGHAEGNPLFVQEYVRAVLEGDEGATSAPIPPTLRALLAARLDRAPAETREVVRRASVVGRTFGRDALVALGSDGVTLERALADGLKRELIAPVDELDAPDRLGFVHVLLRDVAYASVPKGERSRYHDTLSRWIEGLSRGDTAMAAYHAEQAYRHAAAVRVADTDALARRAFALLRRAAGEQANDPHAQLSLYERALGLADDAGAERAALVETRGRVVMARLRLHGTDETLAELDAAIEANRSVGPSDVLVQLLVWRASVIVLDDPAAAKAIVDEAARTAERTADARLIHYARWASNEPAAAAGDIDGQRLILERALEDFPSDDWLPLRVSCLADLAGNDLDRGDPRAAGAHSDEALRASASSNTAIARFKALEIASRSSLASGDVPAAGRYADAAAVIARDLDAPWSSARAALAVAASHRAAGDLPSARRALEGALGDAGLTKRRTMRGVLAELRCALATVCAAAGDRAAAEAYLAAAHEGAPLADARVRRHLGEADRAVRLSAEVEATRT